MRTYHGKTGTPEYRAWNNMLSRCLNPKYPRYKDWGGRGITVPEHWKTFEGFYADMGDRPTASHSLERRDNFLGYSKENCYWATSKEQARNRRSNKIITYGESSFIQNDWAAKLGVNKVTFGSRLRRGWTIQEALAGKHLLTERLRATTEKHKTGAHSRKCEIYIKPNTYKCKFTKELFNKGVAYARPYR